MTIEDELLFVIFHVAKKVKIQNKVVKHLTEFFVPFEIIKNHFSNVPVVKLERVVSDLSDKSLVLGREDSIGMKPARKMFIPGYFGKVELRLSHDGLNRVSEVENQLKDIFDEVYSLYQQKGNRAFIVDRINLQHLDEKGLKDLEKIGYVNVLGRTGTGLFASRVGEAEARLVKPEGVEIEVTEDGLIFAHEHH